MDAVTTGAGVEDFGGCSVRRWGHAIERSRVFAAGGYHYEALVMNAGEQIERDSLRSVAIWVLRGEVSVRASSTSVTVREHAAAQVDHDGVTLVAGVRSVMLLSGVETPNPDTEPGVRMFESGEIKRVEKPWGEELWINGRGPGFAFKRIMLRAGFKTSLQYHELKRETNVLLEGEARLHFAVDTGNLAGPTRAVPISGVASIDIEPMTLHRIEAVTDLTLFEVSTPHLDDVIRISDDANRPDGFIASEHGGAA